MDKEQKPVLWAYSHCRRCSSNNITIFKSFRICNFPLLIHWSETDSLSNSQPPLLRRPRRKTSLPVSTSLHNFPFGTCDSCVRTIAYAYLNCTISWNVCVIFFPSSSSFFSCYRTANNERFDRVASLNYCWKCEEMISLLCDLSECVDLTLFRQTASGWLLMPFKQKK